MNFRKREKKVGKERKKFFNFFNDNGSALFVMMIFHASFALMENLMMCREDVLIIAMIVLLPRNFHWEFNERLCYKTPTRKLPNVTKYRRTKIPTKRTASFFFCPSGRLK
jgi:hypothetical protein